MKKATLFLLTSLLGISFSLRAIPMDGDIGERASQLDRRESGENSADSASPSSQAARGNELSIAEQTANTWTSQKEETIVTQSDPTKDSSAEAQKAQEAKLVLANQGKRIYDQIKGSSDPEEIKYLTNVANAYWRAAEEAEQIENIWTLRKEKNANKTAFGISFPGKKHGQLDENLKEGIRWARLTPEQRRAELTGEKDFYPEVDGLWKQAQEAWEYKAAARWAAENQEVILQKISALLEEEQQAFASKDLKKTTLGKFSSSFEKATSVLQYIGIANNSPAVVSKAVAVVTDIINRRLEKSSLKAASRDLNTQEQQAEQLREEATSAEGIALEKQTLAQRAEERAAQAILENVTKLKNIFLNPSMLTELHQTRFASLKQWNGIWQEGAASVWKERMRTSQEALATLQKEAGGLQGAKTVADQAKDEATAARNKAVAQQQKVNELEKTKTEYATILASLQADLRILDDKIKNYKADDATPREILKSQQQAKEADAATYHSATQEHEDLLSQVREIAASLEEHAAALEKIYGEKFDDYFNQRTLFSRNLQRAKNRIKTEREAYRQAWPAEAAAEATNLDEVAQQNEEEPTLSSLLITPKAASEEPPIGVNQINLQEKTAASSAIGTAENEEDDIRLPDEEAEKLKTDLAHRTFARRIAAAQAWQDYKNGIRKDPPTAKSIPLDEDDLEGHALAQIEEAYRLRLVNEQEEANKRAEAAYWKRSGKTAEVSASASAGAEQPSQLSKMDQQNHSHITKEVEVQVAISTRAERIAKEKLYWDNQERVRRGLPPLEWKPAAAVAAAGSEAEQDHHAAIKKAATIQVANSTLDQLNAARAARAKKKADDAAEAAAKKAAKAKAAADASGENK